MANQQISELSKLLKSMEKIPDDLNIRFIKILRKIGNLCSALSKNGGFVREDFGTHNEEIEQTQTEIFDACAESCEKAISNWENSDAYTKKAFLISVNTKIKDLNISCLEKNLGNAFDSVAETLESLSKIYK